MTFALELLVERLPLRAIIQQGFFLPVQHYLAPKGELWTAKVFSTREPPTEGMGEVGELILSCVAQPSLSTYLCTMVPPRSCLALWGIRNFLVQSNTILPGPLLLIPGHWTLGDWAQLQGLPLSYRPTLPIRHSSGILGTSRAEGTPCTLCPNPSLPTGWYLKFH